jgi:hypothetical protein
MDLLVLQQRAEKVSFAIRRHEIWAGLPYYFWKAVWNDLPLLLQSSLVQYFISYDCVTRPIEPNLGKPMTQPLVELSAYQFYSLIGFWPEPF